MATRQQIYKEGIEVWNNEEDKDKAKLEMDRSCL